MSQDSVIEEGMESEYAMFICEQFMEDIEVLKTEKEVSNINNEKLCKNVVLADEKNNNKQTENNISKTFDEAFNHQNEQQRKEWRTAIEKGKDSMISKNIWRVNKKKKVPNN